MAKFFKKLNEFDINEYSLQVFKLMNFFVFLFLDNGKLLEWNHLLRKNWFHFIRFFVLFHIEAGFEFSMRFLQVNFFYGKFLCIGM